MVKFSYNLEDNDMVTVKKFLKMRNADEKELDEIIKNMSEADAKAYLKLIIKTVNEHCKTGLDVFGSIEE